MRVWLIFIIKNLLVPIGFFITFNLVGAKPAIGVAVGVTALQLGYYYGVARVHPSPFFIIASFFTVVLGCLDLFSKNPHFFRFEPAAQNAVVGLGFLFAHVARLPLTEWFASALPEKVRPVIDASTKDYFRKVTLIWIAYFFAKSALFLYLALNVDLGTLIILRSIIGGVTLAMMVGGEIAYRKLYRERRLVSSR